MTKLQLLAYRTFADFGGAGMMSTLNWQRLEGGLVFIATLAMLWWFGLSLPIWLAVLIFFAPDLSFAAYLAGPKIGAIGYNAVHLYGFGAVVGLVGLIFGPAPLVSCGVLWIAHAGFDRMLGYGLKAETGFKDTHLKSL